MEEVQKDCRSGILRGIVPELCSSPDAEYDRQRNNKLVWDETIGIMNDLFDNVWGDRSEVVADHCGDLTLPVRSLCFRSQTLPCPNNSTRLLSLSLASQVVYIRFGL